MAEVVALAPHCGVDLTDGDVEAALLMLDSLDGEGKNSMLQDREAKRKTEVNLFAGEVCRLGERFGVPTPVNALLFRMIRTLEWQYR
jgi:2-dehydropantoate 2-reductase